MSEDLSSNVSNEDAALDAAVEAGLRTIEASALSPQLDLKEAAEPPDAKVGIYIVDLSEVEAVEASGFLYRFHGARVLPGSQVNPHFHNHGNEPYYFIAGNGGEMNTGRVVDGQVVWDEPKIVAADTIETVAEGQVHSFRNTGQEPFDFAFACPDEHLKDNSPSEPQGDRYLTAELPNGLPPS